jgi:plasmid stabilization system protein ParE
MTTSTGDTRTLIITDADWIRAQFTSGPQGGWRFDGRTLVHPAGYRVQFTPEATARVAAAVAQAEQQRADRPLTGAQVFALPEAERDNYEFSHVDDAQGIYRRKAAPADITVEIARADIVSMSSR